MKDEHMYTGERFEPDQCDQEMYIEHTQRYQFAATFVRDKDVMDAACGNGYGSYLLSEYARSVKGLDIDKETVLQAQKQYNRENLTYIEGSITDIPVSDNSLDVLVSFETIEHVKEEDQNAFILETKRVLRDDGLLIISTPNKLVYTDIVEGYNPFHVKEFYVEEFKQLLMKNYKYVEMYSQSPLLAYVLSSEKDDLSIATSAVDLTDSRYVIAICSDRPIAIAGDTQINVDTRMYYMLNKVVHKYERDVADVQTDARNLQKCLRDGEEFAEHMKRDIQELQDTVVRKENDIAELKAALEHREQDVQEVMAQHQKLYQEHQELSEMYQELSEMYQELKYKDDRRLINRIKHLFDH